MKIQILVIGFNAEILDTVVRLINNNKSWQAKGTGSEEDAVQLFQLQSFDLVLLGGGIGESSEKRMRHFFSAYRPEVPVIQHYGGGSGLLMGEIQQALENRK